MMNSSRCTCHTNILLNRKITNKHKLQLEDLPNELLTDIFKKFDARDLFRSFYNLNHRLNQLIQSFNYLQLYFHVNSSTTFKTNDEIFSFYVHTLIVDPWINFNLKLFPNIRRLKLNSPLPIVVEQLKADVMPYLEHLSILYPFNMYEISILHDEIFSNRFLNLISCELLERQTLLTIQHWTRSPSIRFLKTDFIDSVIYGIILSACPNLCFLKFSMYSSHVISTHIQLHQNLKHMIIELGQYDWLHDDHCLSGFLAYVPNLEKLEIHRRNYLANITEYFNNYDWLASAITFRLPRLRKFKFYFYLSKDEKLSGTIDKNILIQIKSDFINVHKGQYTAQLQIDGESHCK